MSEFEELSDNRDSAERSVRLPDVLPEIYDELRRTASALFVEERAGHTLRPTELVHEAYLRAIALTHASYQTPAHCKAVLAIYMRRVLVDHGRTKRAARHGGGWTRVEIEDRVLDPAGMTVDLLALDRALERLESHHSESAFLVTARFFGGLTVAEVATVLGVAERTARNRWEFARAWIRKELSASGE